MKTALITGATSGIGLAVARLLAGKGYRLIICGRRRERLDAFVAEYLGIEVLPLAFDMRDSAAVQAALDSLPPAWQAIDILINNAGNAHGLAPVHTAELADWEAMLDINVRGMMLVTRAVAPGMVARRSGHILNIGSIAGKETYPNGSVYCASKAAVDAFTTGTRMDLYPYNIRVGAIHPGLVETEFSLVRFKGDEARAASVYKGYQPLTAEDVADAVWYMLSAPAHVNVADMLLLPTAQASATLVHKLS